MIVFTAQSNQGEVRVMTKDFHIDRDSIVSLQTKLGTIDLKYNDVANLKEIFNYLWETRQR